MPPEPSTSPAPDQIEDARKVDPWGAIYRSELEHPEFQKLPASAIRVYLVLLTYTTQHQRTTWPTQATIGDSAGLARRHVNRALGRLEEAGFLERLKLWRGDRPYTLYRLTSPPGRP